MLKVFLFPLILAVLFPVAIAKKEFIFVQGQHIEKSIDISGSYYQVVSDDIEISFKIRGQSYSSEIGHQIFKAPIHSSSRYRLEIQSFVPVKLLEKIDIQKFSDLMLSSILEKSEISYIHYGKEYDMKYEKFFLIELKKAVLGRN